MAQNSPTGKERGLMKYLGLRKRQLRDTQRDLELATLHACRMLYDSTLWHDDAEKLVLEYRMRCRGQAQAYVMTRIGVYENKKGQKSMAHFSIYNNYLGSIKKLGDRPVHMLQWVQITKENIEKGLWKVSRQTKMMYAVEFK